MSMIDAIPLLAGAGADGYQISRSVRLRSSASASFNRTFTTGNTKTWTWSGWVKRGSLSGTQQFIFNHTASQSYIQFNTSENITVGFYSTNSATGYILTTSQVFRDPSAWYHVVWAVDTTQATNTNRIKLYVNGVQVTAFSSATYPAQNDVGQINTAAVHRIASYDGSILSFDGYLTEINFIDGQALTPSSFGETNAITGVWQPKRYAGTYGTNGFYLNFSDNSGATATTIGKDNSGNSNNWTPNNISVTAGTTYDSMLDVPTLYADGGNGRGNYCTWSPLGTQIATYTTSITDGNLTASYNAATNVARINGTLGISSGKWYFEFQATAGSPMIGFATTDGANAYVYDGNAANKRNYAPITSGSPTSAAYGATWNTTNVIGVALDLDAGTLVFYKDNVSQGTAYSSLSGTFTPIFGFQGGTTVTGVGNFGQRPFTYTPPTGFVALNTQNLPTPTISNGALYMAATLYAANGSTQTISNAVNGVSMQPDFVWVKSRQYTTVGHSLFDALRPIGVNSSLPRLVSNSTDAETNNGGLTAFVSNGFSLNNDAYINSTSTGGNMVAWQWNAGGSTVTNTSGTISSQVRANATAGFSVVTWTGTTASSATIGHGLGVTPSMIIVKNRSRASTFWCVYTPTTGNTKALNLNDTSTGITDIGFWNNTNPTSTVFTTGNGYAYYVGGIADNYVAYCFAAVAGYSAFGKYTGNGSTDGPFVFCGFRPRFVMLKRTDVANAWMMYDTSRNTSNVVNKYLFANAADAEGTGSGATDQIDFLSNGFKVRCSNAANNTSGGTYIYACFAENPFKLALAE